VLRRHRGSPTYQAVPIAAALLAAAVLSGCGSDRPFTLLDSDVPAPPEMDVRYSFDIARSGGLLSRGRFILSGVVEDINAAANDTVTRYAENGWTLKEQAMLPSLAKLVFVKDQRTATVELIRRRVDPEMSSAVVVVGNAG
jgi:hypothetical protein